MAEVNWMRDYISRKAFKEKYLCCGYLPEMSEEEFDEFPTADVEPVRRWIPCSEGLPEDGEDVLCWYEYFRYGEYKCMFQTFGIGYQYFGFWGGEVSTGRNAKVLAWMPLPEPPKEGDVENEAD